MLPINLIGIFGLSRTFKVSPGWPRSSLNPPLKWHFQENYLIAVCHLFNNLFLVQTHTCFCTELQLRQMCGYVQAALISAIILHLKISQEENQSSNFLSELCSEKRNRKGPRTKTSWPILTLLQSFIRVLVHWGRGLTWHNLFSLPNPPNVKHANLPPWPLKPHWHCSLQTSASSFLHFPVPLHAFLCLIPPFRPLAGAYGHQSAMGRASEAA